MLKDITFNTIGGLGLFLLGMRFMSNGLRKVADRRLKRILELLTKKSLIAMLVGAGVTCLIQSSSATTVTVVGLVNAGLLTLRQAISVVLGANIGTTFTAWLVSALAVFKITTYALPAVGIGFLINTIGKKSRTKLWGQIIMGFGILFMGIHFMKEGFGFLQTSEDVKSIFVKFSEYPILGVLAGTIVTMLLQSSSATVAMVQVLAFSGLISFEAAIPLILGDNIGTTITAQISAVGTNVNARRAAMAHTLFNVIGVCYMMIPLYLGWYSRVVNFITPGPNDLSTIMVRIAVAHSLFNVFNAVVVFLPLLSWLERISTWLVPGKGLLVEVGPKYLEEHLLDTPPVALEQATKEIIRMGKIAQGAVNDATEGFFKTDTRLLQKVGQEEDAVDDLQSEITHYLIALSRRSLEQEQSESLPVLMHSVNDVERIGDHAVNIVELAERRINEDLPFTAFAIEELQMMCGHVNEMLDKVLIALEASNEELAREALTIEEKLNRLQIELRHSHADRLSRGECELLSGLVFLDFVDNLEKIGDHLTNIAQAIIGGLRWNGTHALLKGTTATETAEARSGEQEKTIEGKASE